MARSIDNFSIEQALCPRKYQYRIRDGFVLRAGKSAPLNFGTALHEGLAVWYSTGDLAQAKAAIVAAWEAPPDLQDHRTLERCLAVMEEYVEEYKHEMFHIFRSEAGPVVEVAFKFDTGHGFDYTGIFDGIVEANGELFVIEHKTTSALGATYFDQFKPNGQITGYMVAAQRLFGRKIVGCLVNAIGVLKTQTKFERRITTRSQEDLDEWQMNVDAAIVDIATHEASGFWPQRTTHCISKYGRCEFHQVCSLSGGEKVRRRMLEQDYTIAPWDPEHRDKVEVTSGE